MNYQKQNHADFLDRQEAAGLCLHCPKPAAAGHKLCAAHVAYDLARATERARAKGMKPRTRRCGCCGRVQAEHDRRRCPERRAA